jgi:hypothetical protein
MELPRNLFPIMEEEEMAEEPANQILITKPALCAVVLDNDGLAEPNRTIIKQPVLRAVVLDNDETTGSYGIIYSLLTHLRPLSLTEEETALLYNRLAHALHEYQLFRPHLGRFLQTLDLLGDELALDAVIMYTNQTCELFLQSHIDPESFSIYNLLYSVPLTIGYLMNEVYHTVAFHKILTRPPLLRGIQHTSCPKSFSRVLDMYPSKARSTEKILFVDDNACPEFITFCPRTETYQHSYVRIRPYVRILTDAELDTFLVTVLHGMSVPMTTLQAIKDQYRTHAPLSRIGMNNLTDAELESLRLAILDFYAI